MTSERERGGERRRAGRRPQGERQRDRQDDRRPAPGRSCVSANAPGGVERAERRSRGSSALEPRDESRARSAIDAASDGQRQREQSRGQRDRPAPGARVAGGEAVPAQPGQGGEAERGERQQLAREAELAEARASTVARSQ